MTQQRRTRRELLAAGLVLGWAAFTAAPAWADGSAGYQRIEEDWELVVNNPDDVTGSPQISLQMAPEPTSPVVGVFLLNYRDNPTFDGGGVQVQLWNGDQAVGAAQLAGRTLGTAGEKVTFTLFMERIDGRLKFGVAKGSSATWGDLAGAALRVQTADDKGNFPGYRSAYSVQSATIVLGAPRVESLKLLRVRKYNANNDGFDTEAGQVVYPSP